MRNYNGNRPSLRERIARFMMGRNGSDALYYFIIGCCIAITVANIFLNNIYVLIFESLLFIYAIFRFMSRNVYKRSAENRKFVNFFASIKNFFVLQKNKIRDRKTHVYHKCPSCKSTLRLPRIPGPHTVNCPRCHHRFDITVK